MCPLQTHTHICFLILLYLWKETCQTTRFMSFSLSLSLSVYMSLFCVVWVLLAQMSPCFSTCSSSDWWILSECPWRFSLNLMYILLTGPPTAHSLSILMNKMTRMSSRRITHFFNLKVLCLNSAKSSKHLASGTNIFNCDIQSREWAHRVSGFKW